MPSHIRLCCSVLLMAVAIPALAFAQIPTVQPHTPNRHPKGPRQEPCWQVAGISKGAMQQRRSIAQNARAEIQSVCANASLTPKQRHEQIRAIHERTRQQMDGLVSPQQREAMKSCQESRGHGGGGGIHPGGGGGRNQGPCGELNEPRKNNKAEPEEEPESEQEP